MDKRDVDRPDVTLTHLSSYAARKLRSARSRSEGNAGLMMVGSSWLMFLKVFEATATGRPLTQIDLFRAAGVPESTGLRHLGLMIQSGDVVASNDRSDARKRLLRLTKNGLSKVTEYLLNELSAAAGETVTLALSDREPTRTKEDRDRLLQDRIAELRASLDRLEYEVHQGRTSSPHDEN